MYQEPSRQLSHHCHGADVICIHYDILCDIHRDAGLYVGRMCVHDDALSDKYPDRGVQLDDACAYAAFYVLNDFRSACYDPIYYYGIANGDVSQSNRHRHRLRLPVRRLKIGPIARKFLILISNFYVSYVFPAKPSGGW